MEATVTFVCPSLFHTIIPLLLLLTLTSSNPRTVCDPGQTCHGHGVCSQQGTCICDPRYSGSGCDVCKSGYYGSDCATCMSLPPTDLSSLSPSPCFHLSFKPLSDCVTGDVCRGTCSATGVCSVPSCMSE